MAFTRSHINAYAIVGGDSDFIALVEKLKQYNKAVFVVGGRAFTSSILQRNCREFISYENLAQQPAPARRASVAARQPARRGRVAPARERAAAAGAGPSRCWLNGSTGRCWDW